jgi:hypothetical protein
VIKENVKKFIAFEWVMLWLFGFFWASAMFLPLFLTGSFDSRKESLNNFLIMFGPYLVYFLIRGVSLIWKVLVWSYVTSNFFFKNQMEKIFADEVFRFLVFCPIWILIMVVPMFFYNYFSDEVSPIVLGVWLFGPYIGYLVLKVLRLFFGSIGWAVQVVIKK